MILRAALAMGTARLRQAGIEGAARDAQLLLAHALGLDVMKLVLEGEAEVPARKITEFEVLLDRRCAREPVSKITGLRNFWGRDFEVTRDVLDPRPETETLVALALAGEAPARLLDLGTGSGILAVTLLAHWRTALGVAVDVSDPALVVARRNAIRHSVDMRLTLDRSDWYETVGGRFDLIVSNPPYIAGAEMATLSPEVLGHDPELALTPGSDGVAPYRVIASGTQDHLAPGGRLLVEIGPRQGAEVAEIFKDAGLEHVTLHPDLDGRHRVVSACAPVD